MMWQPRIDLLATVLVQVRLVSLAESSDTPASTDRCFGPNAPLVNEQQISNIFFQPYGNWQRPRRRANDPIAVDIHFGLQAINHVIEKDGIMVLTGYVFMSWTDEFRRWNHSFPYSCIKYIAVPGTDVWLPDVAQINSDERYLLLRSKGEYVRIYSNGSASYSPGGTFSIFCNFDLTLFPFDTQTCHLELESWKTTYDYLRYEAEGIWTVNFEENEQWYLVTLTNRSKTLDYYTTGVFPHVTFSITVGRKAAYYAMDVILPSLFLGIAFLATFLLPYGNPEKLNISFTCLLAYSVFQSVVYTKMPRSSVNIPLLVIYISLQMAFITFSMLGQGLSLTALEESRKHPSQQRKLPRWVLFILRCFGRLIALKISPEMTTPNLPTSTTVTPDSQSEISQSEASEDLRKINEWIFLGKLIERTVAVVYVLSLFFTTVIIFGFIPASASRPTVGPAVLQYKSSNF